MHDPTTYEGGCHCGAVRFRVVVEEHAASDCNCSICRKKGHGIHWERSVEQLR
jgi:hypothetical protein